MDAEVIIWMIVFLGGYLLVMGGFIGLAISKEKERKSGNNS